MTPILFPNLHLGPIIAGWTTVRIAGGRVWRVGTIVIHEVKGDQ